MKTLLYLLFALIFLSSCSKNIFKKNEQYIKFKKTDGFISFNLKPENYDKGLFYFDTGSAWFIIDDTYYKNQKMSFNNVFESKTGGSGNGFTKSTRILDTINFSIENQDFYSEFNMTNDLKRLYGEKIDGIVGFHNFRKLPFKVDYVNQKITFNPKTEGYQEIAINFDGYQMFLPMKIYFSNNDTITGNFLIDTGASDITLTSEFINNKGVVNTNKATYKNSGGTGGLSEGYTFFVPNIKIDKFSLSNRLIDIAIDTLGALSKDENYIGIIGNNALNDFDIIYHPSEYKIWVKPNKKFNESTDDLFYGFSMIQSDDISKSWLVGAIYEESDAFKQGLRYNDEIVAINDKSVHKLNRENFIAKLKPNQKLKLKVKRANEYLDIDTYLNVFLMK